MRRSISVRPFYWAALLGLCGFTLATGCTTEVAPRDDDDRSGESLTVGSSGGGSCTEGTRYCSGSDLIVCEEGQEERTDCDDTCDYYGYSGDGCSGAQCQCGEPNDYPCLDGVLAYCACAEWAGSPCDAEAAGYLYEQCHFDEQPIHSDMLCFGSFVSGGEVACGPAIDACL